MRFALTIISAGMAGLIFFITWQDGVYRPDIGIACAGVLAVLAIAWRK